VLFDPRRGRGSPATSLAHDYPAGHVVPLHYHNSDQLVYASRGVMTVGTAEGAWVVPTHRAVWIPAKVPHTITMSGAVSMRTLYLRPSLAHLPRQCCVVSVKPLLAELVLRVCALGVLKPNAPQHRRLIDVILDELKTVSRVPLQLPNPTDPRAIRIAEMLTANPGERRPMRRLCKQAGCSARTLERLFQQQVGMSFVKWRQQLRLMHAMRLLAEGNKVTYAALEAGYSTPSAFIAMFRKTLGKTPREYFRND
jgi:AraC-like DNA-binding protein